MLKEVLKYYHTLKYLKWIQIKYRLLYLVKKPYPTTDLKEQITIPSQNTKPLKLSPSLPSPHLWLGDNSFQFINIQHRFEEGIDWNHHQYGKLWTYNLNYFEFLSQPSLPKAKGLQLIKDFIKKEAILKDGVEPFPIALRLIFWVKFLSKYQINDASITTCLARQLQYLSTIPEYHLLGNHLLENGFGLLFGAAYCKNAKLLQQAEQIIIEQLQEQILPDGGHFELSPMYHHTMLYRVLDCINLLQNNANQLSTNLLKFLQEKAAMMLGWMEEIAFANGDMPCLNDSIGGIAPSTHDLQTYAQQLGIKTATIKLKESGYRKFLKTQYEILIDVGMIGPDYIPGHAHSDTFNFVVYHRGQPLIVDTGISTYEKNARRNLERSTCSHNTVMVAAQEQSVVWGGFRVAQRAKITMLQESTDQIVAAHNGYKNLACQHERTFLLRERAIEIRDRLTNNKKGVAFLHFHPTIKPYLVETEIHGQFGKIQFNNLTQIRLQPYLFAEGFNRTKEAVKAIITFSHKLNTKLTLV